MRLIAVIASVLLTGSCHDANIGRGGLHGQFGLHFSMVCLHRD